MNHAGQPRSSRRIAPDSNWRVFAAIVFVFVAAAGYLTWRVSTGDSGSSGSGGKLLAAAGLVVALIALQNAHRLALHMSGWLLTGSGGAVWSAAWLLRDADESRDLLIYSILTGLMAALLIAGCLRLTGIGVDRRAWRALSVDLVPPIVALVTATWLFEIGPFVHRSGLSISDQVSVAIQGLAAVALLVVGVMGALSWRRLSAHPALQTITVGLCLIALGTGFWLRRWIDGRSEQSILADVIFCIGFSTIATGALQARVRVTQRSVRPPVSVLPPRLAQKSMPLSLLGLLALAAEQAHWGELTPYGVEITTGAGLIVVVFALFWEHLLFERESVLSAEIGTLSQRIDGLISQVGRDPLTGLLNRRAFQERLEHELIGGRASGRPVTFALFDVENFTVVNDTLGNLVGYLVLQAIAWVLIGECRASDIAARYAGDEFVMVFPGTSEPTARQICERVGASVHRINEQLAPFSRVAISLSIGVAATMQCRRNVAQLVTIADAAMYDAKAQGKNRVVGVDADTLTSAATWGAEGALSASPMVGSDDRRSAVDIRQAG